METLSQALDLTHAMRTAMDAWLRPDDTDFSLKRPAITALVLTGRDALGQEIVTPSTHQIYVTDPKQFRAGADEMVAAAKSEGIPLALMCRFNSAEDGVPVRVLFGATAQGVSAGVMLNSETQSVIWGENPVGNGAEAADWATAMYEALMGLNLTKK